MQAGRKVAKSSTCLRSSDKASTLAESAELFGVGPLH
jgi:hypothetical protein